MAENENKQPAGSRRMKILHTPSWILPFLITRIATSLRGSTITLYHSRSALPQLSKAQTQPLYNNPLRNVYRQFKDSTKSGYLI